MQLDPENVTRMCLRQTFEVYSTISATWNTKTLCYSGEWVLMALKPRSTTFCRQKAAREKKHMKWLQEGLFAALLASRLLSKSSHQILLLAKTPGRIYEKAMADSVIITNTFTV